jgi:Rrf2 family protein
MKISTKGRYGLRAMIELGLREGNGPILVRDIAAAQGISEDYLEILLISLRKAGLVRSFRGASGGYTLARPAESINALEIIEAVEGSLLPLDCLNNSEICERSSTCAARDLWQESAEAMRFVLKATNLDTLCSRQRDKIATPDFHI